jgi:hypothetical protein
MTKSALAMNNGALLFLKKIQAIPMNSRQWKLKILLLVGRRRTAIKRQTKFSSERLVSLEK